MVKRIVKKRIVSVAELAALTTRDDSAGITYDDIEEVFSSEDLAEYNALCKSFVDLIRICYLDADDDGFRPDVTSTVASSNLACTDAGEAVGADPTGDCDDGDATIYPDATETIDDGIVCDKEASHSILPVHCCSVFVPIPLISFGLPSCESSKETDRFTHTDGHRKIIGPLFHPNLIIV